MISFSIDFEKSEDSQRFINSINEYNITTSYNIKNLDFGLIVRFCLICKSYNDALRLLTVIDNVLKSLSIDSHPFYFEFSELLD